MIALTQVEDLETSLKSKLKVLFPLDSFCNNAVICLLMQTITIFLKALLYASLNGTQQTKIAFRKHHNFSLKLMNL